jgi:transketolase
MQSKNLVVVMRNAFIEELVSLAEANERIILMVGDLGYSLVEPFQKRFPKRFINAGVAEQNMMGMAAGLASEGFHVFVYSIANFPTFRCAEQIRNDVDYHGLSVTVVSVGGGLSYGNMGYSHHAIQDYGLMRLMPNMLIAAPGDPMEVRACMRYLVNNPQPSYLRLGKSGEKNMHTSVPAIAVGKWLPIHLGKHSRSAWLSTGAALQLAATWIDSKLESEISLFSMPLWSMLSKPLQAEQVSSWDNVTTIEDHLIDAGFGSWMLESLQARRELLGRVRLHALSPSVCGLVGKQPVLNEIGGLIPLSRIF